jgi:hypothetical protein
MEKTLRKEKAMLSLITIVVSLLFISNISSTSEQPQKSLPPSVSRYATNEIYQNISDLKSPPPIPIWDQPPHLIYANESLADLISEMQPNKTIGKLPRNFAPKPDGNIINGSLVYEPAVIENTVTPMSSEIIDSDTKSGNRLKISLVFYKDTGEQDPNWDYYAVKATIEDIYAKNDFWNGPLFADIWLYFPDWCEEVPSNHKPEAGFRLSEGEGSFSYQGIGFSMKFPAYWISYESSKTKFPGWLYVHWSYDGAWGPFAFWYYVFKDYTDASIGIRVPQGRKPYCYMAGWAAWYKFWIFVFTYDYKEMVKWCYVDPPEILEHPEPLEPPTRTPPSTTPGPAPKVYGTTIDGFLYTITFTDSTYSTVKYTSMSGMGQNFYGWHAGTYSWICLFAAVSDNGNPVADAAVDFYLVDPNSQVYYLGTYHTDQYGIAGCVVSFDPSLTSGLWWFIPVHGSLQDQCAFSYVYCLLITGYTYMACWNQVFIEDAFLVPENNVVELTATPPSGYTFKYWWINFYYECYENPIYILMDFDCIVLARFDPIYNSPEGSSGGWPRHYLE